MQVDIINSYENNLVVYMVGPQPMHWFIVYLTDIKLWIAVNLPELCLFTASKHSIVSIIC